MIIHFPYGPRQRFRPRLDDITVTGTVAVAQFPLRTAQWRLNGSDPTAFYVESVPDLYLRAGRGGGWFANPIDWRTSYKDSPAGLRLKRLGDFCVEVPITHPGLLPGLNTLELTFQDHGKNEQIERVEFHWDPTPLPSVLDLTDLTSVDSLQSVGQPVNGRFVLDRSANAIRSETPADPDSLLVLGSPHASQEATFRVVFGRTTESKYLGLSDWFVRNEDEQPPLGVKPGYSTAGLATVEPGGRSRVWLSMGDNAHLDDGWLVMTDPAAHFLPEPDVAYRVRHQLLFEAHHVSRFRIWRESEPEPDTWLCEESDAGVPQGKPRFTAASFSLFMHTGIGTTWSDIRVRPLQEARQL